MATMNIDPRSYANILPEVLVRRVQVGSTSDGSGISLDVQLLIRDVPSDSAGSGMIDLIRNNAIVYVIVYDPDHRRIVQRKVPRDYYFSTSLKRNQSALQEKTREYFPLPGDGEAFDTNGGHHMRFNVGSFSATQASQSDLSFSSGTDIYDYTKSIRFPDIEIVSNLKIMAFIHLDTAGVVDSVAEYSGVNLDFASGYFNGCNNIGTDAKITTILQNNKVPEFYTTYIDSASKIWSGPRYQVTSQNGDPLYWSKGTSIDDSGQYDDVILQERSTRNRKVVDMRTVENTQTPYYGGNYAPNIVDPLWNRQFQRSMRSYSQRRDESLARGVTPSAGPRQEIDNYLHELSRYQQPNDASLGEIYLSIYPNKDLDVMFNVDWLEVLKRNSPFFHLMPSLRPAEVDSVLAYSEVTRVRLMRRRVHPENIGISKFLSRAPKPMENEPPVVVSSNHPIPSSGITPLRKIEVVYEDIPESDHRGIATFRSRDTTIKNLKGVYQYYVEYEFIDGFVTFFEDFLKDMDQAEKELQILIERASIPVKFINTDGISMVDPESRGNYNPRTKEFTQQFKDQANADSQITEIITFFISMMRFVDGDTSPSSLLNLVNISLLRAGASSMLSPRNGATLDTMARFQNSFLNYKRRLQSVVSGMSKKQSRRSNTSATTPKGQMPGHVKYVDYFDKSFNSDHLYQPLLNYFPPVDPGSDAVVDLLTAMEEESRMYGMDLQVDFAEGLFLTPHSMDYSNENVPGPFSNEEEAIILHGVSDGPPPVSGPAPADSRVQFRGDTFSFGTKEEKLVDKVLSISGRSSNQATGQKEVDLPYFPPPEVRNASSQPPPNDSTYYGDIFGFANDLNLMHSVMGITVEVDLPSPSMESMLNDLPANLLMTEEQMRHQIDVKFDVLRKLTQNHINQLGGRNEATKLSEDLTNELGNLSLNNFSDTSGGLLGFVRTVASMGITTNSELEVLEYTGLESAIVEAPEEVRSDLPPQFRTDLISDTTTHGVLDTGQISKYIQGMTVEIKELASGSKGRKDTKTQNKINTDLGKQKDSTRSNYNKMNANSVKRATPGVSNVTTGKRYKICRLVPYENPALGITRGKNSKEIAVANEHFLVEV